MRFLTTASPWNTRALSTDLFGEVDKFFNDFNARMVFSPATEISETDNHILLSMDLPGMKKEDIKIDVEGDTLTISGERKREEKTEKAEYQRFERAYGTFNRSFSLPSTVDATKVEARYENGVLELQLPKAEAAKPRRIEIQ